MIELHPLLTHFPVAALFFVMMAEGYMLFSSKATGFEKGILPLLSVAAVTTVASFVTGLNAADEADITFAIPDTAIALHYNVARICLILVPGAAVLQYASQIAKHNRHFFIWIYRVVLLVSVVAICIAGYYGGDLVFSYGAGVSAKQFK